MHLACVVQQMQPSSKKSKQQQQQQVQGQPAEQLLAAIGLPETFCGPGVPRLDVGNTNVMGRLLALNTAAMETKWGEVSGAATAGATQQSLEQFGLLGQPHVATPLVLLLLQLCTQLASNLVVILTSMPLVMNIVRGSCIALQLAATAGTAATAGAAGAGTAATAGAAGAGTAATAGPEATAGAAGAAAGSIDGAALAALQPLLLTLGPALLTAADPSDMGEATRALRQRLDASRSAASTWSYIGCVLLDILGLGEHRSVRGCIIKVCAAA
jgi:hypothetical protein